MPPDTGDTAGIDTLCHCPVRVPYGVGMEWKYQYELHNNSGGRPNQGTTMKCIRTYTLISFNFNNDTSTFSFSVFDTGTIVSNTTSISPNVPKIYTSRFENTIITINGNTVGNRNGFSVGNTTNTFKISPPLYSCKNIDSAITCNSGWSSYFDIPEPQSSYLKEIETGSYPAARYYSVVIADETGVYSFSETCPLNLTSEKYISQYGYLLSLTIPDTTEVSYFTVPAKQ
jgi:hypothetical protein